MKKKTRSSGQMDTVLDELGMKPVAPKGGKDVNERVNVNFVVTVIAILVILFGIFIWIGSVQSEQRFLTIDERHTLNYEGAKGTDENYMYNGFSFVRAEGLWHTQIKDGNRIYDVALHYGPKDVDKIRIAGNLDDSFFNDSDVFITFVPKDGNLSYVSLAAAELSLSLSTAINRQPTGACTVNETLACETRPIITCDNTDRAVLFLDERAPTGIIFDGNCITVHGVGEGLVRATDRLLYQWYGVIR